MDDRSTITRRYLDAIGVEEAAPSLELLAAIVRAHVGTLPFASIGPQLGDELPLDLGEVFTRLVVRRRGGYCFEQNRLLYEVLTEIGFDATIVLARIMHAPDSMNPLTHRISIVEIDGERYVADAGFGPRGPVGPVPLSAELLGGAPTHRVTEHQPGELHLECAVDGGFESLYRFDMVRYSDADCELGHFWSHRHPTATFVNHLVASRILDGEVRSLRNLGLRVIRGDEIEDTPVVDGAHLHGLLHSMFDIDVSRGEADALFARVAARTLDA